MILSLTNLTPLTIFEVVCCGVLSLLYGVHIITDTIHRELGPHLRQYLLRLTRRPYGAFSFGIFLTVITQSSGATSSLLVGLVNARVLPLAVAITALLGANVGSAIALQMLAFHLTRFAVAFVGLGVAVAMLTQQTRRRGIGQVCFGFGLIVFGLAILEAGGSSLATNPTTVLILSALTTSPFILALSGILLSMLFSSSIVGIGLVIVLASHGTIPLDAAIALLLGANVGSTMMALLAAIIKRSGPGLQLAMVHTSTKFVGAVILLAALGFFPLPSSWLFLPSGALVAAIHLGFNVALAVLFVPWAKWIAYLAGRCLPEKAKAPAGLPSLNPHLLLQPTAALEEAACAVFHMTDLVNKMLSLSIQAFEKPGREVPARLSALDDQLDLLNAQIKQYLTSLEEEGMSEEQKKRQMALLYIITDLEAMGDQLDKQCMNLVRRKHSQQLSFTEEGWQDLRAYHQEVSEAIQQAFAALEVQETDPGNDFLLRKRALTQKKRALQRNHVQQLRESESFSQAASALHLDVLTTLENLLSYATTVACAGQEETFPAREAHEVMSEQAPLSERDAPDYQVSANSAASLIA
jgi:phosphate:Na+ symporter